MTTLDVTPGAELPDRTLTWQTNDGVVIDFVADPHTFHLDIGFPTPLSKTTGITGSATAPNVTITFGLDETDSWQPGRYSGLLWATRVSDGKDREPVPVGVTVHRTIT